MRRLLALWGVDYNPARTNACAQARSAGLSCLVQRGTLSMLQQLNRPAMLTLTDAAGNTYYATLTGLDADGVRLEFGDRSQRITPAELGPLWLGQYTLVWRPPAGSPTAVRPGMMSTSVTWLRSSLAALGFDAAATETGENYFDTGLETQLREFQRRNRLDVDGIAGEQTQIMINSLLAADGSPRLADTDRTLSDMNGSD
jgi:general secretion pathway protein A